MNVLMILSEKGFPPDIRVEKEAETLMENGYNLFLTCLNRQKKPEKENVGGINVIRMPFPSKYNRALSFLALFLTRYTVLPCTILQICRHHKIDLFHVHDLTFALSSIILAKLLGVKVILDVHENFPEMVQATLQNEKSVIYRCGIRLTVFLYRVEEYISILLSDKIICVVAEQKELLVSKGAKDTNIVIVSNAVDFRRMITPETKKEEIYPHAFVISYVGGFTAHRGLETLIRAASLVAEDISELLVLLVGKGKIENQLKKLAADLAVENHVQFLGWVPFEEALNYIHASDICVIPYAKTIQTEASFPHKITQYMYFSKPVITSDVASLKRILKETGGGITFRAGDHRDLARKIEYLYHDKNARERLGKNGRKAVERTYNWKVEGKKLLTLYGSLVNPER